ncbi:hypothetical protein [Burkholderia cenocepacia]|uniref:hypothetical protein n=1 Tax=Burkholderia cenocepacia TaxID=95486 RepID=UPI00076D0114|nr:hypothetical protein [Burkholderia cenocepacia]KWU19048.1 hypothetical protein AS149_12435 [Burkholderia cenocepacia]
MHPFTCANRHDGQHGREGGDLGVLIATEDGWVCPHCAYTQNWAHPQMTEEPAEDGEKSPFAGMLAVKPETVERMLAAYLPLAEQRKAGAQVMVDCLRARVAELREGS